MSEPVAPKAPVMERMDVPAAGVEISIKIRAWHWINCDHAAVAVAVNVPDAAGQQQHKRRRETRLYAIDNSPFHSHFPFFALVLAAFRTEADRSPEVLFLPL